MKEVGDAAPGAAAGTSARSSSLPGYPERPASRLNHTGATTGAATVASTTAAASIGCASTVPQARVSVPRRVALVTRHTAGRGRRGARSPFPSA